jgi:thiosulfate/3-mercaptopyruvate sulfurtransferase
MTLCRRFRHAGFGLLIAGLAAFAAPARAADALVPAAWLLAHYQEPQLIVVDVRAAAEFAAGHIPGAVAADFATTEWRAATPGGAAGALPPPARIGAVIAGLGVGDASHVVVVSADFAAGARVYWTFRVLGHAEVSLLDGGWRAWNGPVERGAAAARPAATFTPRYDPSWRAELRDVAAAAGTGATALVDARPPAQWSAGHLPGAVSVDQRLLFGADGRLKAPDALGALFAAAGSRPVIAYCNVGYLGAADWFVLAEVLHRPARLYDGSMSEWTADPARPVAR